MVSRLHSNVYHADSFDILNQLPANSIDMCFTSVLPSQYLLINMLDRVKRVLKPSGCLWLQLPDIHFPDGNMLCLPERVAIKMIDNHDWYLKSKCVWHRTNKIEYQDSFNRFRRDWEYLYFFTKSAKEDEYYFHNPENKVLSSVFPFRYRFPKNGNFESGFPEGLIERAIHRTCPPDGIVLDPYAGSGTTGIVARRMGRKFIMIDKEIANYEGMLRRFGLLSKT